MVIDAQEALSGPPIKHVLFLGTVFDLLLASSAAGLSLRIPPTVIAAEVCYCSGYTT